MRSMTLQWRDLQVPCGAILLTQLNDLCLELSTLPLLLNPCSHQWFIIGIDEADNANHSSTYRIFNLLMHLLYFLETVLIAIDKALERVINYGT